MRVAPKTQSDMDAIDAKLDYIRASYFQKLLTDAELIDAYRNLGYSERGAKTAAAWLTSTPKEYRDQHRRDHSSLY
jgi:hypothetical protein